MADSLSSVTGLASGIQWRDMVDQIISLESSRQLSPLTKSSTEASNRVTAWNSFTSLVGKLGDAAKKLKDGAAFGTYKTAVGASATTGRTPFAASASQAATPGAYQVEVLDLARAEKLSGSVASSTSTALGVAGEILVNGKKVALSATDSLVQVRDKINAANTGTAPSRVTATILSTGANAHRLVLTSDAAGAAGVELTDGTGSPLVQLGLLDGSASANVSATGASQSNRFTATETAIATMLGVSTFPAPASIKIGGRTIAVDLATDSLASLRAKIAAAGGDASVQQETTDGRASSRLVVNDPVAADTPDGQRTLELLGFVQGGRGAVKQAVRTDRALVDAANAPATAATALTALGNGTGAAGVQAGDTIAVRGTRGDGTVVSLSYTVGASDTVQSFLDRLNATDAFGGGARPATASLGPDGRIRLTDSQGGDSQLALSIAAGNEGGGTLSLGATSLEAVGRSREVTAGSDARVRVDGVLVTRGSNSISDALAGVTLDLQAAEPGSVVSLAVTRDDEAIVSAVKEYAAAYNAVTAFAKNQADSKGALAYNGTLRSAVASLTSVALTDIGGLGTLAFKRGTQVGVSLGKTGTLDVDDAALRAAIASNATDIKTLFAGSALTATSGAIRTVATSERTQAGTYAVEITRAAATASRAGTGFSGIYAGAGDTMTVTDGFSGRTESIAIAAGESLDTIVGKLNTAFTAKGMTLTAVNRGGQLAIDGQKYGTAASVTVAYANDGATQLGFPAGSFSGVDVAGTIGGRSAAGVGQLLTAAGGASDGFSVEYTGSTTGSMGSVTSALGIAQLMTARASLITRPDGGVVSTQVSSATDSIARLKARQDDVSKRLETRRLAMVARFTAMESAMSKIQSQSSWLTSQVTALQGSK